MEALSAGTRLRGTAGRYTKGFRKNLHGPMAQGMTPLFLLTPSPVLSTPLPVPDLTLEYTLTAAGEHRALPGQEVCMHAVGTSDARNSL